MQLGTGSCTGTGERARRAGDGTKGRAGMPGAIVPGGGMPGAPSSSEEFLFICAEKVLFSGFGRIGSIQRRIGLIC